MAKSLVIVGVGNMGSALVRGLFGEGEPPYEVRIVDSVSARAHELAGEYPVEVLDSAAQIDLEDDIVVLCIKPQDLGSVGAMIRGRMRADALLVSVLAGTTLEEVMQETGFGGAVVRAMPNIAATIGCAATALCTRPGLSEVDRRTAEDIFGSVGECYWTQEGLMDAVTGLSGSGPAYVYMVIESLTDGGVRMGLPRRLAHNLAAQTVFGAAALVRASDLHPAELRDQVTTPGGTTIHAVHELEERGLRAMLIRAVATATERSVEIRKQKARKVS